jgi:hypothetical protein
MPGIKASRVAVEIVSEDNAEKDYRRGPARYGASGTRELRVFDPYSVRRDENGDGSWMLQVWRHDRHGTFRRVYAGDGPEHSTELKTWVVIKGDDLRVADDEEGTQLWLAADEELERETAARKESELRIRELEARFCAPEEAPKTSRKGK